jgi:hypothetical protein
MILVMISMFVLVVQVMSDLFDSVSLMVQGFVLPIVVIEFGLRVVDLLNLQTDLNLDYIL